jgi:hypothetical protein
MYVSVDGNGVRRTFNDNMELHSYGDAPSCEAPNGMKMWHKNGDLHRLSGPAYITTYGSHMFYYEGSQVEARSNSEFERIVTEKNYKFLFGNGKKPATPAVPDKGPRG